MLTPEYYFYCSDEAVELYSKLDETITRDIVRRIMMNEGKITETAKWQIESELQAGMLYDDVVSRVAEFSGTSKRVVKKAFKEAGIKSVDYDNKIYRAAGKTPRELSMSPAAMSVLNAGMAKTNGSLHNLTMTTALGAQRTFIDACALAELQITSGAFDPNTAINEVIKSVAETGSYVEYPSGKRDKLEVAVRRAVMTGISQTTGEISLANAREMETDLMEISAHAGARPSHAEWQGKIVSISGDNTKYLSLSDIGYGDPGGFKGINCRHDWYPFIEGISTRAYTDKYLEELNNRTVTYNGEEIPQYEAEQRQRAMERQMRDERRKLAAYDEAIKSADNEELKLSMKNEFDLLAYKMKRHESKYADFCKQTGLTSQKDRLQIKAFNRSVSQKAVHSAKRTIDVKTKNTQYKEYLAALKNGTVELKEHQQRILDKLPSQGSFARVKKKDVSLDDLAALSAKAKCEFALFTKGKNSIVLRGGYSSCNIGQTLQEEVIDRKWEWVGHSHPTITKLSASKEDVLALKHFTWQKDSSIIDLKGNVITFTADEQDWFNSILGVK